MIESEAPLWPISALVVVVINSTLAAGIIRRPSPRLASSGGPHAGHVPGSGGGGGPEPGGACLLQTGKVWPANSKRRRRRRHNRRDYFHFIIILCFHSASQAGRRISLPSPFVQLEASKSKRAVESCLSLLSWPQSRLGPKFCSLMLLLFNWNNANVVHCGCCFGNLWGSNRPKQTTDGRKEAKIPAKKPKQATISIFITIMSPKPRSLRLI